MPAYPTHLIPTDTSSFLGIINSNEIIGRANRDTLISTFDENGKFNTDSISVRRIPKLSCNLQTYSEEEDLKIELLGKSTKLGYIKWKPGIETPDPEEIEYQHNEGWSLYFFKAGDIEIETFYEFENEKYSIKLMLIHDPLVINYSHSEFYIYDERRDLDNNADERVSKFSESKPKLGQEPIIHLLRRRLSRVVKHSKNEL